MTTAVTAVSTMTAIGMARLRASPASRPAAMPLSLLVRLKKLCSSATSRTLSRVPTLVGSFDMRHRSGPRVSAIQPRRRLHEDFVVLDHAGDVSVLDLPVTILEWAGLVVVEPDLGPQRDWGGRVHRGEVAVNPAEFCGESRLDGQDVQGGLVATGRELDGDDKQESSCLFCPLKAWNDSTTPLSAGTAW